MTDTDPGRRVAAALAGELPIAELTSEEFTAFNAELDAAISEAVRTTTDFGEVLAAPGVTTVALDEAGLLTVYRPDGSSEPLT